MAAHDKLSQNDGESLDLLTQTNDHVSQEDRETLDLLKRLNYPAYIKMAGRLGIPIEAQPESLQLQPGALEAQRVIPKEETQIGYDSDPYQETREALRSQIPIANKAYQTIYEKALYTDEGYNEGPCFDGKGVGTCTREPREFYDGEQQDEQAVIARAEAYINGLDEAKLNWVKGEMEQGAIVDLVARTALPSKLNNADMGRLTGNYFLPVAQLLREKIFGKDPKKSYLGHGAEPGITRDDLIGENRSDLSFMLASRRTTETPGTVEMQKVAAEESPTDIVSLSPMDNYERLIKIVIETEANADKSGDELLETVQEVICPEGSANIVRHYQMNPVPFNVNASNNDGYRGKPSVLVSGVHNKYGSLKGGVTIGLSECNLNYFNPYIIDGNGWGRMLYAPEEVESNTAPPAYFVNQFNAVR